jgi:hypothetical protein
MVHKSIPGVKVPSSLPMASNRWSLPSLARLSIKLELKPGWYPKAGPRARLEGY